MLRAGYSREREQRSDDCEPNNSLQRKIHGEPLNENFVRGTQICIPGSVIGGRGILIFCETVAGHLRLTSQFEIAKMDSAPLPDKFRADFQDLRYAKAIRPPTGDRGNAAQTS